MINLQPNASPFHARELVAKDRVQKIGTDAIANIWIVASITLMLALLVIGSLTVAGHLQGMVAAGTLFGISASLLILNVVTIALPNADDVLKGNALAGIVVTGTFAILGAITLGNALSIYRLAWTVMSPHLLFAASAVVILGVGAVDAIYQRFHPLPVHVFAPGAP